MSGHYVIAGGSKGIGLELVRQLSDQADQVLVYSRNPIDFDQSNVIHQVCDFSDDEIELRNLPDRINGVAYCPGTINLRSFRSLKLDDFRQDLEINFFGAIKFLKACFSSLQKGADQHPSSAVLFSTVAVSQGMTMHCSIASAKAAIEGLCRSLAAEWAPKIRVNCIAPALTETPLSSRFFANEQSRKAMNQKYALGRTGKPQDVASMANFLLTSRSDWITGQVFGVDGGMSTVKI